MNGTLWINGCHITNTGTRVTFRIEGNGWQWIDEKKEKAGATFTVRQYVRFGFVATFAGTLDVGYDPASHVATIWLSLKGDPDVRFTPIGKLDVDAEGAWSSLLSAGASLLANSPESSARTSVKEQGAAAFKKQFAEGISVAIDLCTGLTRSGIGHLPRGKMGPPGVGETKQIEVEIQPGGVMIFGPQAASKGLTVDVNVTKGATRLSLMCSDQAQVIAKAFLGGRNPTGGSALASRDVRGKASLHVSAARCPISLVATVAPTAPETATLTWRRPAGEASRSSGGALILCPEAATPRAAPASTEAPSRTPNSRTTGRSR